MKRGGSADNLAVSIIGIPFDGLGRAGAQSVAADALIEAGLGANSSQLRIEVSPQPILPPRSTLRTGVAHFLNERALLAMISAVNVRVAAALDRHELPILIGGDCASLLGSIPAAKARHNSLGLLFIDAHEDATCPTLSEDGEAANMEIAILLGRCSSRLPEQVTGAFGHLSGSDIVMVGMRDSRFRGERIPSIRNEVALYATAEQVLASPSDAGSAAAAMLHRRPTWLHVDLDVLDRRAFASYGGPGEVDLAGGLTWAALEGLVSTFTRRSRVVGLSVAIYNPEKDPTGLDARNVVAFIESIMPGCVAATQGIASDL